MWQERIQRYLLPGTVEQDPEFRSEVNRLSHIGLRVIGAIEMVVSVFMIAAQLLLDPNPELVRPRLLMGGGIVGIGLSCVTFASMRRFYPYSRPFALASGLVAVAVVVWGMLQMTQYDPTADDFIPGQITLITLVVVAAIPLRPTDTLLFGFLVESIYVILALISEEIMNVGSGVNAIYVLFIFMLTCLASALTAVVYEQRRSTYEWHRSTLKAAEELRLAESRNLLSQNAASVGRLAAALSHELNSPIGALVSGVDTLLLLAGRQATSSASEQQRLVVLQNELRRSIQASSDRLREIVARMQRFTNLDKAEVQAANINDILSDVTALMEPNYKGKATIELDLNPVPPLVCRPQQLSAVFSNLLGNAVEATNGNGRVQISTHQRDSEVVVAIEDNGRGLAAEQVDAIFDPGFKVTHGRVSTGNWSMFSSRQIIREHGGDIHIQSRPGAGTLVSVVLPLDSGRMPALT